MSNLDCFKLAQVTVKLMATFILFDSDFKKLVQLHWLK